MRGSCKKFVCAKDALEDKSRNACNTYVVVIVYCGSHLLDGQEECSSKCETYMVHWKLSIQLDCLHYAAF